MHDKKLEAELNAQLTIVRELIDCIGPTPLRRELDKHRVLMYRALRDFDQREYENNEECKFGANADQIQIIWSIEDIQTRRENISDEDARIILKNVDDNHDANVGVNWDVIDAEIESFLGAEDEDN